MQIVDEDADEEILAGSSSIAACASRIRNGPARIKPCGKQPDMIREAHGLGYFSHGRLQSNPGFGHCGTDVWKDFHGSGDAWIKHKGCFFRRIQIDSKSELGENTSATTGPHLCRSLEGTSPLMSLGKRPSSNVSAARTFITRLWLLARNMMSKPKNSAEFHLAFTLRAGLGLDLSQRPRVAPPKGIPIHNDTGSRY